MSFVSTKEIGPGGIILISTLTPIGLFLVLFLCAYKVFSNEGDRNDYRLLNGDIIEDSAVPHEFLNDEESLLHLADEFDFTSLPPEEQSAYLKGEEFVKNNPPNFQNIRGKSFTHEDDLSIRERGIGAFEFEQEQDILHSRYIVADKTEVIFQNNDAPYSTATAVLNLALPVKNRPHSDTVYFETKVFEYPNDNPNGHFSIGLVTKPYPSHFRLPGYNTFSIGYESTGNLKINKPFPAPLQQHQGEQSQYNAFVLPPLQQGDVVGFGYVIPTGTIFITRNGRKLMDVMKSCFIDLYPAVGCFLTNAKFQVNIGQLGFVWIEANVRKYGFISTSDYKKIVGDRGLASLPEYTNVLKNDSDKVLEKGEELPPRYPEDEIDFFGGTTKIGSSTLEAPKGEKYNKETKVVGSSSQVTDDPEEIMDMRERLYEQNITNDKNAYESAPLLYSDSVDYETTLDESDNRQYDSMETNESTVPQRPKATQDVAAPDVHSLDGSNENLDSNKVEPIEANSSSEARSSLKSGSSDRNTSHGKANKKNKGKKGKKKSKRK
ncbi:uncharacterized protein PRCAT00003989001 [Priceomyces carsonii]|uniref:uncharacterized protein n=1 Tax=Priceomyces carsonii TaxID=28549 RepID=UPI002EDB844E|nr:unnamed protein product [Priceomyces carsonii]